MVKELQNLNPNLNNIFYARWTIFMVIHKLIDLDKVVNFLKTNNLWAYVYTHQHYSLRYYFLYGYIILPFPQNHDWFVQNLGEDGEYLPTNENPNAYRTRAIDIIQHPFEMYPTYLFTILIKIDKGLYIPHTGPYMYTTKPHSKYNY
jgi:hypothetical protein